MSSTLVFTTSTAGHRAMLAEQRKREEHAARVRQMIYAADEADYRDNFRVTAGRCTACGSVEVMLDHARPDGTGYGCEVCS